MAIVQTYPCDILPIWMVVKMTIFRSNFRIFSNFCSKHRLWVYVKNRLDEAALTSTHNRCFTAKIRKNVYPRKSQFYYIKVGCKEVLITRTCYDDGRQWIVCTRMVDRKLKTNKKTTTITAWKGYFTGICPSM